MSWHYSQALVADFSARSCLGVASCAQLKKTRIALKSSYGARKKATYRLSRYGVTPGHLTGLHGVELWIASLRASRASPSALPESGPEKPTNVTCGPTQLESFAKLNPDLCSWKTSQAFFDFLTSGESLPTWPRAASWDDTTAYRRLPLAPLTGVIASGLWPTAPADSVSERKRRYAQGGMPLTVAVQRWPTPKANDAEKRGNFNTMDPRNGLPAAARNWPTPSASDHKGSSQEGQRRRQLTEAVELNEQGAKLGQLNPAWVEWLMGWPIGWTALEPLAMDRFREWQRQHSAPSIER